MLKRTTALLLALLMMVSLAACGGEKEPANSPSAPAGAANSPAPAATSKAHEATPTPEPTPEPEQMPAHTWDKNEHYTITLEAPETMEPTPTDEGSAEEEPAEPENICDFTSDSSASNFTFMGDTFRIRFEVGGYSYNTSTDWKDKYGETEPSFADWKKSVEEGLNGVSGSVIQVNGEEVVEQRFSVMLTRYYNTDGMAGDKNREVTAKLFALDEEMTIDDLLKDETVKAIFNSIKVTGK